jgi:hypothetical protein
MLLSWWRIACVLAVMALAPSIARADDVAEASAAFASGNEHFQRAQRLHGDRRTQELTAALTDYFASLRIVRSRNVLYNAAIVLEQLERWDECFNYWTEYLGVTGLSDTEQADGTTHREAVRTHVGVMRVDSLPIGADVWIDRRDLASRGHTPLQIAVPAGEHHLYLSIAGYRDTEMSATVVVGELASVHVQLPPLPVSLQVLAPDDGALTLDGEAMRAGVATDVAPGPHVLHLEVEHAEPVERRIEVVAGGAPMVIDLASAVHRVAPVATSIPLGIRSDVAAHVMVDGVELGEGSSVIVPVTGGMHELRLVAPGHEVLTVRQAFVEGTTPRLDAHLARREDTGVLVARAVLGVAALGGIATSIGLLVDAQNNWSAFNANPTPEAASTNNDAQLRADVGCSLTALAGVAALAMLFVDAGGGQSEARFSIAPSPTGLSLAATGRFGGL